MRVALRSAAALWLSRCLGRVAAVMLCVASTAAMGQDLVHVEEDWQLVVADPDANSCGPQVACTMSCWAISIRRISRSRSITAPRLIGRRAA